MKLAGARILVTGAARRVGKAVADDLEAHGARVFRHARADGDLARASDCEAIVDRAATAMGGLDGMVLSASVFRRTPLDEITAADWDEFLGVNTRSVALMILRARRVIAAGAVVVIGDGSTKRPWRHYLPYAVSKAALRPLVENLALELAPSIRVNIVSPGPVLPPDAATEEDVARLTALQPLKRLGTPESLLPAIRDALTNEFMTGAEIRIDGGRGL